MAGRFLDMWTVYDNTTTDRPGMFGARRFEIHPGEAVPTGDTFYAAELHKVMSWLETQLPGGAWLPRSEDDDSVILGSWF